MNLSLGHVATFTVSAVSGKLTGKLVEIDHEDRHMPYAFETDTGHKYWPYPQNIEGYRPEEDTLERIEAKLDKILKYFGIPND